MPKSEGDQQHSATASRARPMSSAAPSARPTTTSGAKPKHSPMPDLIKQPKDLVKVYAMKIGEPPSWWPDFLSLYQGHTRELPATYIQQQAKKHATGFWLPTAQAEKLGSSLQPLLYTAMDFLSPWRPQGLQGFLGDKESKNSGPSQGPAELFQMVWWALMCSTGRDLQGCVANLMQFEEEIVLEMLLLEPTDDLPIVSPTPEEEATLLDESQEAQVSTTSPLMHEEQAPEPKNVARLGGDSNRAPRCMSASATATRSWATTTRVWTTSA